MMIDGGGQVMPEALPVAGDEVLTTSADCSKRQQNNNDESDFCPLVIDTSPDSELESSTALGLRIQKTTEQRVLASKAASLHPEHMMPLPTSPSSYTATLPSEDTVTDYTRNCCSSASSSDSQSMKNASQLSSYDSPTKEFGGNKSHGKGSAPCKTRRKGDRILPVEVDETGSEKFLCPICSDVLLTASDLTKHIRSHNTSTANPNSCTICGKVLSSQSSLDRHMLVHSGERPFQCRVCQMSFTTNGNMHRHMRIHEKELTANMSGSAGGLPKSVSSQMRNHKQLDHAISAGLPLNQMKSWQTSKRKHSGGAENETPKKRQAASQVVPVPAENSHSLVSSTSLGHSIQSTQPPKEKTDSPWPCTACDKKFLCVYGLESHMSDSHAELGAFCGLCNQAFATVDELQNHKVGVHSQTSAAVAERKMEAARNPIPIGFHNLDYMDFSSETFVNTARVWCEKNQQQPSSTSHDFTCDHCHHAFPTAGILQLHMDTHSPQTTSTCAKCDCTFGSLAAYRSHMTRHVSGDIIARYTKIIGANDNDLQDCISKQEFMMVLGLQVNNRKVTKDTSYRDLNVNSVYFEMLPTMSADKGKPVVLSMAGTDLGLKLALQDKKDSTKSNTLLEHLQAPLAKNPQTRGMSLMLTTPKSSEPDSLPKILPSQIGRQDVLSVSRETPEMSLFIKQEPTDDGVLNNAASYSLDGSTLAKEKMDSFVCRFCDEIFSTERLLKAHERGHLGLSPYQCSMCKYSSTDKSTLVRHLRTHNGEHPFQCRICNSVFTTKANCERHIRKRHCKDAKADIEASLTYNQFITDNTRNQEAFASPDTVCKYCGEDFRYFRALKHHLRCHSSCRYKPFICKLCSLGFSIKANCIRHIQKQHLDVEHNRIEQHIQVNDASDIFQDASEEQTGDSGESIISSTPVSRSLWSRKRPLESPIAGFDGAGPLHDSRYPTYITSPPVPVLTKVKNSDSGFDQPLDFSMKASVKQEDIDERSIDMKPHTDEVPIDLSVRKQEKCKTPTALYPTADAKVPTHLLHSAARLSHLDECQNRVELKYDPEHSRDSQPSGEMCINSTRNIHSQLPFTKETVLAANSAYNSDSELASITKILDTTDAARFRTFFSDQTDTSPINSDHTIQKAQFISVLANGSPNARLDTSDQNCDSPRSEISEGILPMLLPTDLSGMQFVEDGEWEQRKKKRNSYSELPHKLQCPFCPRAFPWISSLNRHILTHTGQKPFKCPQCPVTFSTKSNRERHMVRKHGLDIHDPATRQMMDRPFKCHLCVFSSFSTAGNLMKHYKDRHPEREMPQQLASSLIARYALSGPEHVIDMTDSMSTASDVSSKSAVALNMSNTQVEDEELLQDEHCQKSPDLTSSVKNHNEQTSASPSISDPPTPTSCVNPSPQNSSITPPPTADNPRHINPERDNYNVDKITECWKCGVTYESRKNLLRHLKEHSIDLPFKCYLCDASFSNRLESLEHKVSRHRVDWDMISEKNKIENISEFSRAQERLVQQTLAGKILKDADDGEDGRVDTDYAQRKVYCSLCIKRFWSLQDLRRHMRSHTGERPFECDVCQARFTLKHSMMRHRRKHCDADTGNAASDDDNSTHTEENGDIPNLMSVKFSTQQLADDNQEEINTEAGGDLLHNLLGVETSAIDKILNSADDAAALLGINKITTAN